MTNVDQLRGQYAGFVSRLVAMLIDLLIIGAVNIILGWIFSFLLNLTGITIVDCEFDFPNMFSGVSIFLDTVWCTVFVLVIPTTYFLFIIGYPILLWTLVGQTIGKYVMGVRVVRMDGKRVTLFTAVRRLIGYAVSFFVLGLGFFWILASNQRQGWHDKIAGTYVIYAWEARENKRMSGRISDFANKLSARRTRTEG